MSGKSQESQDIGRSLLQWFRQSARQLPWRETRDPYAIWVSEIMLQQTRVEAVIPFYERFLARFPAFGLEWPWLLHPSAQPAEGSPAGGGTWRLSADP